jgi:uncharacterized membrane protein
MIKIKLFSRPGCHLCDDVVDILNKIKSTHPHDLEIIDIEQDIKLHKKFVEKIPVVHIGPYQLQAPITEDQLKITLSAALDREKHASAIEDASINRQGIASATITTADRISYWLSNHYLAIFNLVLLIYIGLPFLAPILMKNSQERVASWIYNGYSIMCHQLAFRSYFLFGEQRVYPRESAGIEGFITYEQATGNDPEDLLLAREFIGNEVMGYKVALCQRDIAIYIGLLSFGILFALTGRKIPPLPWFMWLLIGIAPMALDGFSQLVSQLPLPMIDLIFPYRESTPFLRYLTGFLFGFSTAWFGYPLVESSMRDTRQILAVKFKRNNQQKSLKTVKIYRSLLIVSCCNGY